MNSGRRMRIKKSIFSTLLLQLTTLICGLIVPRQILSAYGSEAYGATTSIAQFLSYITLLEGGIGGVARAALYKPLADGDRIKVSIIVNELKRFFRIIAYISIGYAIILACSFKRLSHIECYDFQTTFLLVIAMAISTFGQYFIGISYSALIQADQRVYIVNALSVVTTIINTLMVLVLVHTGCDLVFVKFVSSCIYLLKPTVMKIYVRRHYGLITVYKQDKEVLSQRWTGLGQHIAYYIHSNTDVAVLTLFENLKTVSIYSVYHMVTGNIQNVISALCSGMESLFGDMIARKENKQLNDTFSFYENMISIVCCILYSTTLVMIIPFIKLYTQGVKDTNYIQPAFAYLLTVASALFSFRFPYQHIITAAGHFKRTRIGAYGEATINVGVSVALVWKYGIEGVAIGTIIAIGFRLIYSVRYLSKEITKRPIAVFLKRTMVNMLNIGLIIVVHEITSLSKAIENYGQWFLEAFLVTIYSSLITILINLCFYRKSTCTILGQLRKTLRSILVICNSKLK